MTFGRLASRQPDAPMSEINVIIMWVMMAFMLIAAFDRVLDQFGGAEEVLKKVGLD